MRIERISDKQMKFVLMADDLRERDICIGDLSYGSEKTQQLFREITGIVQEEDGFAQGETPLMLEAMKQGLDSLIVIVTKIDGDTMQNENNFSLIPSAKRECRFKRRGRYAKTLDTPNEISYSIFSFESFDILAAAVIRLPQNYKGKSQVHKHAGLYYLALTNETEDTSTTQSMEAVLYEFGRKHISCDISHSYLLERGEAIIADNAVEKLLIYQALE